MEKRDKYYNEHSTTQYSISPAKIRQYFKNRKSTLISKSYGHDDEEQFIQDTIKMLEGINKIRIDYGNKNRKGTRTNSN